ncbi:hypothetical protein [Paraburkholderia sp. J94]|uniref:hypothetical protein n=1 Tax=Paraburkholderia sp. J94 TaxID=2805441 RepID=UPI002AB17135|nr:hypothetical protein [Paraburkholderia sp. J94]
MRNQRERIHILQATSKEADVPKDANTTHMVVKVLEQFNSTGAAMEEGADVGYE